MWQNTFTPIPLGVLDSKGQFAAGFCGTAVAASPLHRDCFHHFRSRGAQAQGQLRNRHTLNNVFCRVLQTRRIDDCANRSCRPRNLPLSRSGIGKACVCSSASRTRLSPAVCSLATRSWQNRIAISLRPLAVTCLKPAYAMYDAATLKQDRTASSQCLILRVRNS